MRNLKRALSLTLASVMLLGMMVVGSSAAGYPDVAEDDNVEAIEVVQSVGVMVGDENGNFRPGDSVSRAEMAVVMGKLLNLDYNYYSATCPFTDVSGVYDWARGWVGAAAANGIVSGRGDGIYDPAATVTAVEAASMMMRALGYFKYQNDYADGFEVSTVRLGTTIGIFDGVGSSATEPMTRNQVAQMVLNALQSAVVEPDGNTINLTTPDGTVYTGKVNYVSVTSAKAFASAIKSTQATSVGSTNLGTIVELGERLYDGELRLYDTATTSDDFNRPSRTWEFKGKEIGTYMKKENIRETYTTAVSERTLYDLLGRSALEEYTVSYYVDGVRTGNSIDVANKILRRTTNDFGQTANGVLTQVFVDTERGLIDISSIHTFLAKAAVDYNATTESVILGIYSDYTDDTKRTVTTNKTISLADVPAIADITKDEYVLVNLTGKNATVTPVRNNLTGYEVVIVDDVEIMSDSTLTKFAKKSDKDTASNTNVAFFKSVVTGGTEYKNSAFAFYSDDVLDLYDNTLLADHTYNIYLDKYGYAVGIDLFSGDDNYVFITGFDTSTSNIALGSATAAAIFTDGTMKTIKVNVRDTNKNIDKVTNGTTDGRQYFTRWANKVNGVEPYALNRWYTYTVDAAGEYTLTPATRMFTTEVLDNPTVTTDDTVIKCDSVRIDEYAADMSENGAAAGRGNGTVTRGNRAYGNDNSVFIVVEADESADNSTPHVISDVAGVYTGVQNVEIEVFGKSARASQKGNDNANDDDKTYIKDASDGTKDTALYDSIYTLYNKDNYIIASIILGEAKGSDANYAYILTAATSEEHLDDGSHVWEFDAIVDGKIVTLKTNSKFTKVISDLEPGHVQELRYSGDYVTGVKTPTALTDYWTYDKAFDGGSKIDKEVIVDIGHHPGADVNNDCVGGNTNDVKGSAAWGWDTAPDNGGHLTKSQATDLKVIGRTMYLAGDNGADRGLTLVDENTPAVVLQKIDGSYKKLERASVATAIAELGDADTTTTDKKEFEGRIVAVLNSQGVAKWVVFISDTEVLTASGGTATGGKFELDGNATTVEVEEALKLHKNVTINNTWVPRNTDVSSNIAMDIPADATLTINGNFQAADNDTRNRVRISGSGKLVVKGTFATNSLVSSTIGYAVDADAMNIYDSGAITINANVNVQRGNMTIYGSSAHGITINANKTVNINGDLVNRNSAAETITIYGTLKTRNLPAQTSNLTLAVNSVNSLEVAGYVDSNNTITIGTGSVAGYAKIGELKKSSGTAPTVTVNKIDTTKVPEVTKISEGTVTVAGGSVKVGTVNGKSSKVEVTGVGATAAVTTVEAGATVEAKTAATTSVTVGTVEAGGNVKTNNGASATIGTAKKDSVLTTQSAADKITITEELNTCKLSLKAGSEVKLEAHTVVGEEATVTDNTGRELEKVGSTAMTIRPANDVDNSSETKDTATSLSTLEAAPEGSETKDPINATMNFVYDEATFEPYKKTGASGDTTWQGIVEDGGVNTLPWLWVKVEVPKGSAVTQVKAKELKINGTEVTMLRGAADNGPVEYKETWSSINAAEAAKAAVFHWEMKKSGDTNENTLSLDQTTVATNGAKYTLTFEVTTGTGNNAMKAEVVVEGVYNGPAAYVATTTPAE